MRHGMSRRRALTATSGLCGSLLLLAAKPAAALSVEPLLSESPAGQALASRCGVDAEHPAIIAMLRGQLLGDPGLASASQSCPLCGCTVTLMRSPELISAPATGSLPVP